MHQTFKPKPRGTYIACTCKNSKYNIPSHEHFFLPGPSDGFARTYMGMSAASQGTNKYFNTYRPIVFQTYIAYIMQNTYSETTTTTLPIDSMQPSIHDF